MLKMNKKGFTLVELLVVLAILGLLAGIGIPQYMATLERSREAADNAIIATVQSSVDGYMAETGMDKAVAGTGDALRLAGDKLNALAKANSILTGTPVTFGSFLQDGELPESNAFKSKRYKDDPAFDWLISEAGKVSIKTTLPSNSDQGDE